MVTTISHENQYMIYVTEKEAKAQYGYRKEMACEEAAQTT
jgi:hypothetical protein